MKTRDLFSAANKLKIRNFFSSFFKTVRDNSLPTFAYLAITLDMKDHIMKTNYTDLKITLSTF